MYKPPLIRLEQSSLSDAPAPAIYARDFNSGHTDWDYKSCNQDGEFLVDWASASDATLLFDPNEPATFISGRWKTETNPDLAFAKVRAQEPLPVRCVLHSFPCSQHKPSLITTSSLIQPAGGKPVCWWNFRNANWPEFEREVDVTAGTLPGTTADNIDEAYEAYCRMPPKSTFRGDARPTTSRAETTSVKICCVHTHKQHQERKEYQQPPTSSPGSTTSAKRGGRKPSSQFTSPTQADEHGTPSTS